MATMGMETSGLLENLWPVCVGLTQSSMAVRHYSVFIK